MNAKTDKPFNAGDAEQVRDREKTSELRREQLREGLRYVMADPKGRAWMRYLLVEKLMTRVGVHLPPPLFTGNSTTFYNAALRELGDLIAAEIEHAAPHAFNQMKSEGAK